MKRILAYFPRFSPEKLVILTRLVVTERNAVAQVIKAYRDCALGVGVLACQVVRNAVMRLAASDEAPWLTFRRAPGLAYTVLLAGVPLRIQPDVPEIRDVLPDERAALNECLQGELFPEETPKVVLRMEVAQRPGRPVDQVFINLVDPAVGTSLARVLVYDGATGEYFDTTPLAVPPSDATPNNVYQLKKSKKKKKDGEG